MTALGSSITRAGTNELPKYSSSGARMIASNQLRDFLVRNDRQFKCLSERHQELETRLAELSHHQYRSAHEEMERVDLKKRKLQLKDQMANRLKSHRELELTKLSAVQKRVGT